MPSASPHAAMHASHQDDCKKHGVDPENFTIQDATRWLVRILKALKREKGEKQLVGSNLSERSLQLTCRLD